MSFPADLYTLLHTAAVDAIVGERIYPVLAPQGVTKPYVVWRRNGGDPLAVLSGGGRNREFVDVFIGAYADTFDAADALGDALRAAVLAATGSGKGIITPPIDGFEPDTKLFSVIFQARLFYRA
jgi:hypothetical protein